MKILIGIDPGVNTGVAVTQNGKLMHCASMKLHNAFTFVKNTCLMFGAENC